MKKAQELLYEIREERKELMKKRASLSFEEFEAAQKQINSRFEEVRKAQKDEPLTNVDRDLRMVRG